MITENPELDAINHLLEIEKNASILVNEAHVEADKRISLARAQFSAKYKDNLEKISEELEIEYQNKIDSISKKYADDFNEYKLSLEKKVLNKKDFSELLEKLLLN